MSNTAALGQSGAIDVLAVLNEMPPALERTGLSVWVVAECKRAKAEIKTWVFVRDPRDRIASFVVTERATSAPKTCTTVALAGLGYGTSVGYRQAHQVFECNELLDKNNRNQDNKVYKPMRQANHGLTALVEDCVALDGRIKVPPTKGGLVIPVVVTTAELVVASYEPTSVDVSTGTVSAGAVEYKPAQWVAFAFPLPDFMAIGGSNSRTTFVVQAAHWPTFLKGLADFTI